MSALSTVTYRHGKQFKRLVLTLITHSIYLQNHANSLVDYIAIQFEYFRIRPVYLQLVIALLVIGSVAAILDPDLNPVLAGILFVLFTLLENTSRCLATRNQPSGHNLKVTLVRYLANGIFFLSLGINTFIQTGSKTYVFVVLFSIFLWAYLILLAAHPAIDIKTSGHTYVKDVVPDKIGLTTSYWWNKHLLFVHRLAHSWLLAAVVLLMCAAELTGPLFLLSPVILILLILYKLRLLACLETDSARALSRSGTTFLFYMVGISILLLLITGLPFTDVIEAIQVVGADAVWLLFVPAVWVIPYAITLKILLHNRITVRDALYTQVSGDAFNSITPLLGLGGEPYKAKHLSNFVSLEDSSRAIVQSRLIHALSGVLFAAIVMLTTVLVVDLSGIPGFAFGLVILTAIMFSVSGMLLWVTMSRVPSRLAGFLLSRFRIIEDFRHDRLSWRILFQATFLKLLGRTGKFLELYVIFRVLDINPGFSDLVLVEAMILASINIFFFVPQGIGVNEAGIVTAITIAGYAAATGVAFGLIRRARMVIYAVFGLAIYLWGRFTQFGKSRYREHIPSTEI